MDRRIDAVIQRLHAEVLPTLDTAQANQYPTSKPLKPLIDELAVLVNLSVSRLQALFKAEIGLTIRQYVKRLKLKRAQELARDTYLRVSEIAAQLGFDDISHFLHDFKRMFGVTPTEYRRSLNPVYKEPEWSMKRELVMARALGA